jgi:hypothetical protein
VEFVDTPEEAVRKAGGSISGPASVLAVPHGGMTYPIL